MKKCAIYFLLAVASCFLIIGCSPDVSTGGNSNSSPNNAQNDDSSMSKFGEVYAVYDAENSKFYNGQSVSQNFKDLNGNYLDLVFHAYLVAYKSIVPAYAQYVETLDYENAQRHQNYNISEWKSDLTYVEYCTYRFKSTGAVCFVEIRVFKGDFETKYKNNEDEYYAKSIRFDPLLRYDLNRKIEIATGNPISKYNPLTYTATFAEYIYNPTFLNDALSAISSSMTVYPNVNGKKLEVYTYNNERYVSVLGVCLKTSVNNSTAVESIYSQTSHCKFQYGITHYIKPFNYDGSNYYFELTCELDSNNHPKNYSIRLLNNSLDAEWYAREVTYNSLEALTAAFAANN